MYERIYCIERFREVLKLDNCSLRLAWLGFPRRYHPDWRVGTWSEWEVDQWIERKDFELIREE